MASLLVLVLAPLAVSGRVCRGRPLAALGPQASRADQRGPGVVDRSTTTRRPRSGPAASRSGTSGFAGATRTSSGSSGWPMRASTTPSSRSLTTNLSRRAPSRDGSVLLPPQQARARRGRRPRMSPCSRPCRASPIRRCGRRRAPATASAGNPWRIDVRTIAHRPLRRDLDRRLSLSRSRTPRRRILPAARPARAHRPRAGRLRKRRGAHRARARGRSPSRGPSPAAFEPFEPPEVHGSAVWQKVSGEVKLDARFERLQSLEYLVAPPPAPASKTASGRERSARPSSTASRRARSGSRFRRHRCA